MCPKQDARCKSILGILWDIYVCVFMPCKSSLTVEVIDVEGMKLIRKKLVYENINNDDPLLLLADNSFL